MVRTTVSQAAGIRISGRCRDYAPGIWNKRKYKCFLDAEPAGFRNPQRVRTSTAKKEAAMLFVRVVKTANKSGIEIGKSLICQKYWSTGLIMLPSTLSQYALTRTIGV
jgi:hypothetical protein